MRDESLNEKELELLRLIADTLLSPCELDSDTSELKEYYHRSPSDVDIIPKVHLLLRTHALDDEWSDLRKLLRIWDTALFSFIGNFSLKKFSKKPLEKREAFLLTLKTHTLPQFRKGFQILKKIISLQYYASLDHGKNNPNWKVMGYERPLGAPAEDPVLNFLKPYPDQLLECDILIIGSGAGGSVAASILAQKGMKVIVLEKGTFLKTEEMLQSEAEIFYKQYERGGLQANEEGDISILSGSGLGGGTTINWAGCIPPPEYILQDWAESAQLPFLVGAEFQKSIDWVQQELPVVSSTTMLNEQNSLLYKTGKTNDLKEIDQNILIGSTDDQAGLGFISMGDRYGKKQSSPRSFLQKACTSGAVIITHSYATRIIHSNGSLLNVEIHSQYPEENSEFFWKIRPKKIIIASGAIHSPALLLRSGYEHPLLGKNLFLHPVGVVAGLYDKRIAPWEGVPMSRTIDTFTQLYGNHGFKIECPPVHPGLLAYGLPYQGARNFKSLLLDASRYAVFFALLRDKNPGEVRLDSLGHPIITYRLGAEEEVWMRRAHLEILRMHFSAGAKKVFFLNDKGTTIKHTNKLDPKYHVNRLSFASNRMNLFSAHQMGTCPMGGKEATSVVNPEGLLRHWKDVYICDASIFPKSSGVNPMMTVMSLAHYIADQITL